MARGESTLTPEQYRSLIEEYGIRFDGPIPSKDWPTQYVDIFRPIHDIKSLKYEEYSPNERRAMITVAEIKDRVARLNRIAYTCRMHQENEATWRGLAEPDIVSRFATEVTCPICHKRLWDSEFKALPDDPIEARNLQKRRAKRRFCDCTLEARAMQDCNVGIGAQLFSSRFQTKFLLDPADRQKGLGSKEPDRVFGLRHTKAFNENASALERLRRSPFRDGKVLYPFLIIEAKSEKRSTGFEYIETQTAFPIRTLLKLQKDLSIASGVSLNPLVWFLANQGDKWVVYGAASDDSKWRIIDLWHGSIRSRDETLQLLLILDYICDWARDIYRRDILRCLAKGDVEMRDVTPAYTISSQTDEPSRVPDWPSSPIPRATSPEESSLIDLTLDEEADDIEMEDITSSEEDHANPSPSDLNDEENASFSGGGPTDQHPLLRFSPGHKRSKYWSKHATIRHSNLVLFSFHHIAVPEDPDALRAWLSLPNTTGDTLSENNLLTCLIQESKAVAITTNGILQLENIWTRANHQLGSETDDPIIAWVWFCSYIRSEDWQIVRELNCLTVSAHSFRELVAVAGIPWIPLSDNWSAHRCHCLNESAQSLRSLYGKESAITAMSSLVLRLDIYRRGEAHFGWTKESNTATALTTTLDTERSSLWKSVSSRSHLHAQTSGFHSTELLEELLPGRLVNPFLADLLEVPAGFGNSGAALLHHAPVQPAGAFPRYCLMVLDDTSFDDERALGGRVLHLSNAGDLYVPEGNEIHRKDVSDVEKYVFGLWADTLLGKVPTNAQWPSQMIETLFANIPALRS